MKLHLKARFIFTIWICKIYSAACRVILKRGSSAPGAFALLICPWILRELSSRASGKTIVVSGTNGKTTTNNLLYTILKEKGMKVICNNVGANLLSGIITAYINGCSAFGALDADYVCLEIDEASAAKAFDSIKPDYMIITNFFRDQLDRYGELDLSVDWLRQAVEKTPETVLVLNGDDPLCGGFDHGSVRKRSFFGIGEQIGIMPHETKECRFCIFCNHELKYHYYHYSQLGNYYCEHCGFCRPALDFHATGVKLENALEFIAADLSIRVNLIGVHNIYNILAAISVVALLGIDLENLNEVLSVYKPQMGRMEEFTVHGVPVILNLSKNPIGFNQIISDMLDDMRSKDVVIIINDNAPDGTDVSWLWDADFEALNAESFSRFAASGIRAEDMYLRMKYAGISLDKIHFEKDIQSAIRAMISNKNDVLYILTNYTPLFETRKILLKLAKEWANGINANPHRTLVS